MPQNNIYQPTDLGKSFEQLTLNLPDDYEGKVTATLVRKNTKSIYNKAVLYIHGFNDYFYQEEMADRFEEKNINFLSLGFREIRTLPTPSSKIK